MRSSLVAMVPVVTLLTSGFALLACTRTPTPTPTSSPTAYITLSDLAWVTNSEGKRCVHGAAHNDSGRRFAHYRASFAVYNSDGKYGGITSATKAGLERDERWEFTTEPCYRVADTFYVVDNVGWSEPSEQ